ncbi:MAG: beta-propeller domain-containing protein, partial [Planctomycetota bacterium]
IVSQNSRYAERVGLDDGFFDAEPVTGEEGDAALDADGGATGAEGEGEGEGEGSAPPEDGDFSGTTIQEEGVDEADVVKTDGTYLYVITGEELHIASAVPADDLQMLGSFRLKGWGRDLYLVGDRAVALTSASAVFYPVGVEVTTEPAEGSGSDAGEQVDSTTLQEIEPSPDVEPWFQWRPQSVVTVIDVSDRSNPALISQTAFDGDIASSRMIGGVLRLVLANRPEFYHDVLPLGAPEDELGIAEIDLDALLPDFETASSDGETTRGNIVDWEGFFRPVDPDGFGVTTVITLDTAAPDSFDAVAVVAEPGLIYASTKALYLPDTDYYFDFRRVTTDVYKFAFEENTVSLVGAGTVPGRILNQYSMGEYQDYLRVATTTDGLFFWETGQEIPSSNSVYVLGVQDEALAIVGSVEGLGITEQIQSARFVGPRGYVVTFRQIDPLFTLDLSDPTDPRVVGELKVPGFSTFLTPMDEDHLLTVGVYVDPEGFGGRNGVQLSIFDVSQFDDPQQTHNVVIGDWNTYSEATRNPKAFTYFAAQDLVALPIENYGFAEIDGVFVGRPRQTPTPLPEEIGEFRGLFVYRVTPEDGFDYLGALSTDLEQQDGRFWNWGASFTRGVFIEDHVYAVTDRAVVAAPVADVAAVASSVEIPFDMDFEEPGFPEEPEPVPPDAEGTDGGSEGGGG